MTGVYLLRVNLVAGLVGIVLSLGAGSTMASEKPPSQVVVQAGLALPHGQLGSDFNRTRLGLGATNGLEIGFAYRLSLSPTVTLAPNFLFMDFGGHDGVDADGGDFQIKASSYRYEVEVMVMKPGSTRTLRPLLAMGIGYFRNRVTGPYQDFSQPLDQSLNTLGYSLRLGAQIVGLEFSVVYNINRFNTWQLYRSDYRERYNWDNLSLRAGWLIPFGK